MKDIIVDKKEILNAMSQLPEKVSIEEIIQALNILTKIKSGLKDFENNKFIPHEELKKEINTW